MLQGFEQYFFKKEPELTISQTRGVFFNTGTVQALGKCEYVQIFFKDSERLLAIQFAKKLDNCAVPFRPRANGVTYKSYDFNKKVLALMGVNFSDYASYKVKGVYLPKENAVVFDLKKVKGGKKNERL